MKIRFSQFLFYTVVSLSLHDIACIEYAVILYQFHYILNIYFRPHMSQLGQVPGTGAYKDVKTSNKVTSLPLSWHFQQTTN